VRPAERAERAGAVAVPAAVELRAREAPAAAVRVVADQVAVVAAAVRAAAVARAGVAAAPVAEPADQGEVVEADPVELAAREDQAAAEQAETMEALEAVEARAAAPPS
jgi:hypothetical protein